jgi:hypothetical protein
MVNRRVAALVACLSLGGTAGVRAAGDVTKQINDLTHGLDVFISDSPGALPFAAGAGNDISQAYIGQLLELPPHFAIGATAGFTTIPSSAVLPLTDALGIDLKGSLKDMPGSGLPLPFAVLNLRLGGIGAPYDVGIKFGFLPSQFENVDKFAFSYKNFGIDARYNLIEQTFWGPHVSVGAGFNYLSADVTYVAGAADSATTFTDPNGKTLTVAPPTMRLSFSAWDVEAKIQVSKTIFYIITPYAGLATSIGSGKISAAVEAKIDHPGTSLEYWNSTYGLNLTDNGFSKEGSAMAFGLKAFGGLSVNVLIIKVDAQVLYNIVNGSYGASAGVRIQL